MCENDCPQIPVVTPDPCYQIDPCNDGCADTIQSECVITTNGGFYQNNLLLSLVQIQQALQPLIRAYNLTAPIQLVQASFLVGTFPRVVSVDQNSIQVTSQNFIDQTALLAYLQTLDPTWLIQSGYFTVKGTNEWLIY